MIDRSIFPLTVGFADGELFITIGVEKLQEMMQRNNCFSQEIGEQSNLNELATRVAMILSQPDEDGSTLVSRMLDQACVQAVEDDAYLTQEEQIP